MASRKEQHHINAGIEKHFLDDAIRDHNNMEREGHALIARGLIIRGQFDLEEARTALEYIPKRKSRLAREIRLSR